GPTIGASGNSTSNISIRNSIISSGCYVDGSASLSAVGSLATDAACLGAQTLGSADTLNRGDLGRYVAYSNYAGGYYLLSPDSAAIDKADATYCEERDQRNQSVFTRGSSNCDAGAIEYFISKPAESNSTDQKATAPKMPPPVAHTCQDLVAQGYGVWAAYGLTSGVQCQRRDHSAIGIQWVLDAGLLDAVDVWGYADQAVEICFPPERGRGGIYFIDSTVTPNAAIPWPSELRDGFICAAIDRAGTLTLVSSGAPMPIPTKPAPSAASLKNCMVTTDTIVNFRDGPDGDLIRFQDPNGDEIYGWLPANVTLTALDRTPGWFLVDYHGTQGWITVWRVTEAPSC
ncbi:MAG: SH3 domain-containing protein, partial [Anaerolineae bacterium]|nr:SH3 domain-containing protein [Anaerolineae bacterium]